MRRALQLVLCVLLASASAFAHSNSRAFLRVTGADGGLRLELAISIVDLESAIGLDSDGDGLVTWSELSSSHAGIEDLVKNGVRISRDAPCALGGSTLLVDNMSDGAYAVLRAPIECGGRTGALRIDYELLFDVDTRHRAFGNVRIDGETHLPIFDASRRSAVLGAVGASAPSKSLFGEYFVQGVLHIWEGYDHILFLLALLLPCVIEKRSGHAINLRSVTLDVVKVVTAFTIAHSITLTLASLAIIELPSRLVESVIAASVVLAALNNLVPIVRDGRWWIAFVFGLLHGFGFASVLADVGLPESSIFVPLLAFNIGVEAGQLAIVAVFVPIAFMVRDTWIYRKVMFLFGSLLIALLAAIWLIERVAEVSILS